MKKLIIAAAVATAATINTGAEASATIGSSVIDIQFQIGKFDVKVPCAAPFTTGLALYGSNPNIINMAGQICLDIGLDVALDIVASGTHAADGSIFNGGNIDIYADMGTGSGWIYYDTVAVTGTDPIDCLIDRTNLGGSVLRVTSTFGIQVPPAGINSPLPGLFSGTTIGSPGMNDATCAMNLFGGKTSLFLSGRIWN